MIGALRLYQAGISPLLLPACRFHPSCSEYAVAAIASDGARRGTARALSRLARCLPGRAGGLDLP